jgi:hypothetical protein
VFKAYGWFYLQDYTKPKVQFSLLAFACEGLLATTLISNRGHCDLVLVTLFVINLTAFRTV